MATGGNILKAVIDVSAPGAKETFAQVGNSASIAENALKKLGTEGKLSIGGIQNALKQLKQTLSVTTNPADINKLNAAITALKGKLSDLSGGSHFEKVQIGSLRASNAALNLSSSLGILGSESSHATHGIESILFSFENLRAQTGSTAKALEGMAGTIGTGLAIGLAITLISKFVEGLSDTEDGADKAALSLEVLKVDLENLSKSFKEFKGDREFADKMAHVRDEINGITGAQLELNDKRRKSISDNLGLDKANESLDSLNTKLQTLITKAGKTAPTLPLAAFAKDLELIPEDIVERQSKSVKAIEGQFNELIKKIIEFKDNAKTLSQETKLDPLEIQAIKNKKALEDFEKFVTDTISQAEKLSSFLAKRKILNIGAGFHFDPTESRFDNLKDAQDFIKKALTGNFPFIEITVPPIKIINPNDAKFDAEIETVEDKIVKQLSKAVSKDPLKIPIPITAKMILNAQQVVEQAAIIEKALRGIVTDGLSGIGEAIGETLAGGDIAKGIKSFLGAIAGGIQNLGKQLIAFAVAQKLAIEAAKKFNPFLTAAAGLALVVIGAAMRKAISGSTGGNFAEGGFTGHGGKYQPAGVVHKGEFVIPAFAVQRLGVNFLNNLAFGNNIKGFQSGGLVPGIAGGMSLRLSLSGETITRGQDLITVFTLANQSNGRLR